MSDEIPDIQRRIAAAIEIEVQQPDPPLLHDHLRGIKVPMNSAGRRFGNSGAQAIASLQDTSQPGLPIRSVPGDQRQVLAEYAKFVPHRMPSFRPNARAVEFMDRLGDPRGERDSLRFKEPGRGNFPGDFALKPHVKSGDDADRFRHRHTIRAVGPEAGPPDVVQEPVIRLAKSARPYLPNQRE